MKLIDAKDCACLFCGGKENVQMVARDDGSVSVAICEACREELATAWASGVVSQSEEEQTYSDETKRVMAEAAAMNEEDFEEKYLSDTIDRVIFEYVRGYGQTELDGGAMGLLAIMTEKGAEEVAKHIEGLVEKGLIYPVVGKPGCFGADYPFADD